MLLAILLTGFLALAAGIAVRWRLRRVDVLGRVAPFPTIRVGLSLALALACAIPLGIQARVEGRLERAATQIAGTPVQVHCQGLGQAFLDLGPELGFVRWGADGVPEHSTLIKITPCARLRAWLDSAKDHPTLDQVIAVHVLTHETMHMVGFTEEAHAECAAVQRDAAMAQALGASPAEAAALARTYWTEVYPRMPEGYVGGCGAGGQFDERLPAPPW
ncbi:hypothetical protein [Cellulomonas sp. ICMP 17802]|uniref:hypothetical protein n=1 Tax=Cellulomonas sp. ICMP 17802 TaxID=3239199 RepID=UPI00351B5A41